MPDEGIEMMSEFHSKELLEGLQNLRNMNVRINDNKIINFWSRHFNLIADLHL